MKSHPAELTCRSLSEKRKSCWKRPSVCRNARPAQTVSRLSPLVSYNAGHQLTNTEELYTLRAQKGESAQKIAHLDVEVSELRLKAESAKVSAI